MNKIQAHAPALPAASGGLFFGILVCQRGRAGGGLKGGVPAHPRQHHCFALRASRLQSLARLPKKGSLVPRSVFLASQLRSFRLQALRASQSCWRAGQRGAATSPRASARSSAPCSGILPPLSVLLPQLPPPQASFLSLRLLRWGKSPSAGG